LHAFPHYSYQLKRPKMTAKPPLIRLLEAEAGDAFLLAHRELAVIETDLVVRNRLSKVPCAYTRCSCGG
jgi:hypothetical protein